MSNKRVPSSLTNAVEKKEQKLKKLPSKASNEKDEAIMSNESCHDDQIDLKTFKKLINEANDTIESINDNKIEGELNEESILQKEDGKEENVDINEFFKNVILYLHFCHLKKQELTQVNNLEALEDFLEILQQKEASSEKIADLVIKYVVKYTQNNIFSKKLEFSIKYYLKTTDAGTKEELSTYLNKHFDISENSDNSDLFPKQEKILTNKITQIEYHILKAIGILQSSIEKQKVNLDLQELNILNCPKKCVYNSFVGKKFSLKKYIQYHDSKITFLNGEDDETQYYIDLNLDFNKKYVLIVQFDIVPEEQFTVAVAQKSQLMNRIAYDTPNSYFSKTFCPSWNPTQDECNNIVKGLDLAHQLQLGQMIEVRISPNENLVEFVDFPGRQNINSNFNDYQFIRDKDPYVIAFTLTNKQQVSILSLTEVTEFIY